MALQVVTPCRIGHRSGPPLRGRRSLRGRQSFGVLVGCFLFGWLGTGVAHRQAAITALAAAGVARLANTVISHVWLRERQFIRPSPC